MWSCVVKLCALALFVCVVSSAPVDERDTSSAESSEEEGLANPAPVYYAPPSGQMTAEVALTQVEGQSAAASAQEEMRTTMQGTIPSSVPQLLTPIDDSQSQKFFAQPEEAQPALNSATTIGGAGIEQPPVISSGNPGQIMAPASEKEVDQVRTGRIDSDQMSQTDAASSVVENGQMSQNAAAPTVIESGQMSQNAAAPTVIESGQMSQNTATSSVVENGQMSQNAAAPSVIENGQMSQTAAASSVVENGQMSQNAAAPTVIESGQISQNAAAPSVIESGQMSQNAAVSSVVGSGQIYTEISTSENQVQTITDAETKRQIIQDSELNSEQAVPKVDQMTNEQGMVITDPAVLVNGGDGQENVLTSVVADDAPIGSLQGLEAMSVQSPLSNQVPQKQDEEPRSKRQDYSYASAGSGSDYGGYGGYGGGSESQAESQSASFGFGPFHASFSESEASSQSGGGRDRDFDNY